MVTVEVIPYSSFKQRIRLIKSIKRDRRTLIEIYSTYIYVERGGTDDDRRI
jgi:hypothetical protein